MRTKVIFWCWRDTGDVIALFPEVKADPAGNCLGYMHIGQHGAAGYLGVVAASRPASRKEYLSLARELRLIGYRLRRVLRRSSKMRAN
jgi:hypothetical protein